VVEIADRSRELFERITIGRDLLEVEI